MDARLLFLDNVLGEKNKNFPSAKFVITASEALVTPTDCFHYPKWGHDPPFGNHCSRKMIKST